MPGLLEGNDQLAGQGLSGQGIEQQPTTEQQGQQAAPEQQEIYDKYIAGAYQIIHGEKSRDTVIKQLKNGKPVDAVANTTVMIMDRVDHSAALKKIPIPDDVRFQGGNEIMGELINIGNASGALPELGPVEREAAFRIAVGKYMSQGVKTGKITPEKVQALNQAAQQQPNYEEEVAKFKQLTAPNPELPIKKPLMNREAQNG